MWALVSFSFCLCSSIRKNYTRSSCMFIKRNNKSLSMKPKQNPSSSTIISPFLHLHFSLIPTKSASPQCLKPSTATNLSSVTPLLSRTTLRFLHSYLLPVLRLMLLHGYGPQGVVVGLADRSNHKFNNRNIFIEKAIKKNKTIIPKKTKKRITSTFDKYLIIIKKTIYYFRLTKI